MSTDQAPDAETLPTVEPITEQHGWLTPEELVFAEALDDAAGRLSDAGYAVANSNARTFEAEFTVGGRHARVSLLEGKYWLIERHRDHEDGRRIVVDEEWPATLAAAEARALRLAVELTKAHDEEQQPAAIAAEVADDMATGEVSAA